MNKRYYSLAIGFTREGQGTLFSTPKIVNSINIDIIEHWFSRSLVKLIYEVSGTLSAFSWFSVSEVGEDIIIAQKH